MFLFTDFSRPKVWVLLLHLGAVLILKWTSCKSMANVLPETWGLWQPWSQCSATCGDGVRERRRVCLTSFPSRPGCPGMSLETSLCSLEECAGRYPSSFGILSLERLLNPDLTENQLSDEFRSGFIETLLLFLAVLTLYLWMCHWLGTACLWDDRGFNTAERKEIYLNYGFRHMKPFLKLQKWERWLFPVFFVFVFISYPFTSRQQNHRKTLIFFLIIPLKLQETTQIIICQNEARYPFLSSGRPCIYSLPAYPEECRESSSIT